MSLTDTPTRVTEPVVASAYRRGSTPLIIALGLGAMGVAMAQTQVVPTLAGRDTSDAHDIWMSHPA
ncbi:MULTISPECIES: hypothetical protein [unclassified Streptomyces]|uniref:hypothetical protein n=1 Tax=unclassified Streptomyces TaxID=2593676 RepID=UPI00380ECD90